MKQIFAKLISNLGLILIAMLAVGIWTSNVQSFLQKPSNAVSTAQAPTFEELLHQAGDPGPRLSVVQLYERELEQIGRRVKAAYPGAYDDLADEELGRKVKAKYPDAAAICNDNTPSYSQSRAGTCSYHGGVKAWLRH